MNRSKNLEKELKELKNLTSTNNSNQIEGERQLRDLKDAVIFIFNKFDELECDRFEKGKIIKDLKEEVTYLRGRYNRKHRQSRAGL